MVSAKGKLAKKEIANQYSKYLLCKNEKSICIKNQYVLDENIFYPKYIWRDSNIMVLKAQVFFVSVTSST